MALATCIVAQCLIVLGMGGMAVQRYVTNAVTKPSASAAADEKQAPSLDETMCEDSKTLYFRKSMVQYSNLGGHGPDSDMPGSIRISDVMPYSGVFVDLVITNDVPYFASPDFPNKIVSNEFLSIGMNSGSETILKVAFKDRVTDSTMMVPGFTLTFVEFAHVAEQGSELTATICNHTSFVTSPDSRVGVMESGMEGCTTIGSVKEAEPTDIPEKAMAMKSHQLDRTVVFEFGPISEIILNLTVAQGMRGGRFVLAGSTNLACPERALCNSYQCPVYWAPKLTAEFTYCETEVCTEAEDRNRCCELNVPTACAAGKSLLFPAGALMLSNLGNDGPMVGGEPYLWYHNVFPFSNKNQPRVDLRVSVRGSYEPANTSWNGQHGNYGSVNVADNTQVDLKFEFFLGVNSTNGTDVSSTAERRQRMKLRAPFYFSILDFDTQENGEGIESVAASGIDSYSVTNTSTIVASKDNIDRTVFTATEYGIEPDNPMNPLNLTREQLDKSVTLLYPAKTESFTLTMKVQDGYDNIGRNFLFSGWTEVVCPRTALCMTYECPPGQKPKSELLAVECEGLGCYNFDVDTCCEEVEPDVCQPDQLMTMLPGSMVINNLGGIGPDSSWSEDVLRVSDVFPFRLAASDKVDLVITAPVYRAGVGCQNRIEQGFLKFCLATGTSVHLNCTFVHRIDNRPVVQSDFSLTVANLIHDAEGGAVKSVEIQPAVGYSASEDTRLGVQFDESAHKVRLSSKQEEPGDFPPTSPYFLDMMQRTRSASATVSSVSSFRIKLTVGHFTPPPDMERKDVKNYREFFLAGASSLSCTQKRSCGGYSCPAKLKLRYTASNIICKGDLCTEEECCMPDEMMQCHANTTLNFTTERMIYTPGHPLITLPNVFPHLSTPIDLELRSQPPETAEVKMQNPVLSVTLEPKTCITWVGKLLNRKTGALMRSPFGFWLTFFNMKTGANGTSRMEVTSTDFAQYHLIQATSLIVGPTDGNSQTFRASVPGPENNIGHMMSLTDEDLHKTLALQFNTSVFHVTLCVGKGNMSQSFAIGGQSNLMCPRRARCDTMVCPAQYELREDAARTACVGAECTDDDLALCCKMIPCDEERMMGFGSRELVYSNIGGNGPDNVEDEAMVISDVLPHHSETVDLVIRAMAHYYPNNVSRNGLWGEFVNINMKAGTHATFHFQFVHHTTRTPIVLKPTLITIADIDEQKKGAEEMLTVRPYIWEHTAFHSELQEETLEWDGEEDEEEIATAPGALPDNPQHPLALPWRAKKRAVTYLLAEGSEFWVNYSVGSGWGGRNFLFAGASNIDCDTRELCEAMDCPVGMIHHQLAPTRVCQGSKCDVHSGRDVLHCCSPVPEHDITEQPDTHLQYFSPSNESVSAKGEPIEVESWILPQWGEKDPAPVFRESWQSPAWGKHAKDANVSANVTENFT